MRKKKINLKVIVQSVLALVFLALMFLVNWWFIVPAVVLLWLNQRELFR